MMVTHLSLTGLHTPAVSLRWLVPVPPGRQRGSVCSQNGPGPRLLVSRLIMVCLSEMNALLCCLSLSFLFSTPIAPSAVVKTSYFLYSPVANVMAHNLKHINAGGAPDLNRSDGSICALN